MTEEEMKRLYAEAYEGDEWDCLNGMQQHRYQRLVAFVRRDTLGLKRPDYANESWHTDGYCDDCWGEVQTCAAPSEHPSADMITWCTECLRSEALSDQDETPNWVHREERVRAR